MPNADPVRRAHTGCVRRAEDERGAHDDERDHDRHHTGPREEALPEAIPPMAPRLREALANNPALDGVSYEHLWIQESDGHVVLRGREPTVADAVQVELSIRHVRGVTSVTNELRPYR